MSRLTLLDHAPKEGCDDCVLRHGTPRDSVCRGLKGATLHQRQTPEGLRWKPHEDCPLRGGVVLISSHPMKVRR